MPEKSLIITGKTGTLGQAIAKICGYRNIQYILTGRDELDIADENNIATFLKEHNPWAVINTAGYVRVDDAEHEPEKCFAANTIGPILLSRECKKRDISFVTISSDLVFDGNKNEPYCENDVVHPLNVYGASKAKAEENILQENEDALIIRTSAFFGPWDRYNFAFNVLKSLSEGNTFSAADDVIISPTYVPHLADTLLTLLIDGEKGIWHLANTGAISWKAFAKNLAVEAGYDPALIRSDSSQSNAHKAKVPSYSVLASNRGFLMPPLAQAIKCFFKECNTLPTLAFKPHHHQDIFD